MKTLRRLRELTDPESFRLFGWSLLMVFVVATLLRFTRLPVLLRYLTRPAAPIRTGHKSVRTLETRAVDRVRRYSHVIITGLLRSRRPCLLRSLVLYRYCWKCGVPVSIHFGVRSGMGGLEGHSWVTCDGIPLGESDAGVRPYIVVYSFPINTDGTDPHDAPAVAGYLECA
ncbi:MAG: lasso peptide biosynthesis B2 protein [Candidatus Methylomirabilis oxygeniifera]|uniref:Microcin J25-processing protein McjB C-terminal domain-containing protein n=1 Tax=Methylomirabilis oxygeniifera TaxID=671143 RepID=D5MM77_METO1|nr:MAG: lasso peptide biosynthesis B2 protein [Candidatus Methylomirabilis oxyfera]CBE67963.1 conserved protein of unknown function [Candidatus Methylomirabilis oxyfera]